MDTFAEVLLPLVSVRYLAVLRDGALETRAKPDRRKSSEAESDKFEELIVNPTLTRLLEQRGKIDCGGLRP